MAYLTYCSACSIGDHDNHVTVVKSAPKGMIGGALCKCKGECRDFPQAVPAVLEPLLPTDDRDGATASLELVAA